MKTKTWFAWGTIIFGWWYWHTGSIYVARHYAYPYGHQSLVERAASQEALNAALISAVILQESKYEEEAISDTGALGLMQLMPDTAHWIAEKMELGDLSDKDLSKPDVNIALGSWYLAYLLKEYEGNEILALAAYNAGHGHVDEWMKVYGWNPTTFDDISAIPFPETRIYVRNVLQYKVKYEELYGSHY